MVGRTGIDRTTAVQRKLTFRGVVHAWSDLADLPHIIR